MRREPALGAITDDGRNGTRRVRAEARGVVQGVGFRPFVYRLARSLGLAGSVRNDGSAAIIEVEGRGAGIDRFLERLGHEAPPLARIATLTVHELAPSGARDFAILESGPARGAQTGVPPDIATCAACVRELFDPADRRYRYPFINCTDCGPRFTIVRGAPYDRRLTTMERFAMCDACRAEYENPADRRFHAQPNACADCGPTVRLLRWSDGWVGDAVRDAAVRAAAQAIAAGAIVALKGIGGYHLACRADDAGAVARLRARKRRGAKPFAVMVTDADVAGALAAITREERALLEGRERPIVLLHVRAGAVAPGIAPGLRELGVMLPYSPIHWLLLRDTGLALVMTSGNLSDEPIAYRDEDALRRFAGIADLVLAHDRPIRTRTDDSVARVACRAPVLLRRARGFVPAELPLPVAAPVPLLACGGQLKNTFAVARGGRAWIGPHIGDLDDWEALRSYRRGIAHLCRLLAIDPAAVVYDLHPDYASTRFALRLTARRTIGVQHHHAHFAACLAEHGETGPALGVIYDGTGYGEDGTIRGGEILLGDVAASACVAHLLPVPQPGGDAAAREPWRMACAWLAAAAENDVPAQPAALDGIDAVRWKAVARMARTGTAAPVTTSMGRLFDAVAALCGVRAAVEYEAQAAMELEALAGDDDAEPYMLPFNGRVLDARPTIGAVCADAAAGVPVATIAARFHAAVAAATADACTACAERGGVRAVVLSGGVFQNRRLLESTCVLLERAGLRVLTHRLVPPNDGGIAYGQLVAAAARLAQ